jgi:hypothetical protein
VLVLTSDEIGLNTCGSKEKIEGRRKLCGSLDFVDFFADHNWIVLTNFLSSELSIVETAIVLVAVAMSRTKEASATAFETFISHQKLDAEI